MGYYTEFEIEIDRDGESVMQALNEDKSGHGRFYHQEGSNKWTSEDRWKWNDHEEAIKAVSLQFPLSRITVTGYGEDRGDIWRKYFCNGQVEKHRLAIEFPPCTLQPPGAQYRTIDVTVLGHDIPVEVEFIGNKSDDELYEMAKEQLRRLM
jgi:hypothetical protein